MSDLTPFYGTVSQSFQPITFVGELFFPTDSNSVQNFAFFDTHIKFFYLPLLALFANLKAKRE
jgi:hypothetical protein